MTHQNGVCIGSGEHHSVHLHFSQLPECHVPLGNPTVPSRTGGIVPINCTIPPIEMELSHGIPWVR